MISLVSRRDSEARARLADIARRVAPVALASKQLLTVAGPFGDLLANGGIRRGSVVTVTGVAGTGITSVAAQLAAAATAAGEWAAFVDPGSLGGMALAESGLEPARTAIVRNVSADRWPAVVGALLDGITIVVAALPPRLALGDARRLVARARERQGILIMLEADPGVARVGTWPAEAAVRIRVDASHWQGLQPGVGLLVDRSLQIEIESRGAPRRARLAG